MTDSVVLDIRRDIQAMSFARMLPYPLTIVLDRYFGAYSGGIFTAWNLDFDEVPTEIMDTNVICAEFWKHPSAVYGAGTTPSEETENLVEKLGGM